MSLLQSYWIFFSKYVIAILVPDRIMEQLNFLIIILKFCTLIPCHLEENDKNMPILLITVPVVTTMFLVLRASRMGHSVKASLDFGVIPY